MTVRPFTETGEARVCIGKRIDRSEELGTGSSFLMTIDPACRPFPSTPTPHASKTLYLPSLSLPLSLFGGRPLRDFVKCPQALHYHGQPSPSASIPYTVTLTSRTPSKPHPRGRIAAIHVRTLKLYNHRYAIFGW